MNKTNREWMTFWLIHEFWCTRKLDMMMISVFIYLAHTLPFLSRIPKPPAVQSMIWQIVSSTISGTSVGAIWCIAVAYIVGFIFDSIGNREPGISFIQLRPRLVRHVVGRKNRAACVQRGCFSSPGLLDFQWNMVMTVLGLMLIVQCFECVHVLHMAFLDWFVQVKFNRASHHNMDWMSLWEGWQEDRCTEG